MFAKQAQIAVAAIALTIAGSSAFAQSAQSSDRVFDTETNLRMPAAASSEGLTRDAVQAQYIAKRASTNIASFNPEAAYFAQNNDSSQAIATLFNRKAATSTAGISRDDVRAELPAQRNVFDTETDLRIPASVRPAPTTVAQR